jgi:hypothetical protein
VTVRNPLNRAPAAEHSAGALLCADTGPVSHKHSQHGPQTPGDWLLLAFTLAAFTTAIIWSVLHYLSQTP